MVATTHDPELIEYIVREVTRRTIETAAPGGGYCLSSSNSIHSSVKPQNLLAMRETLREYGEYPIGQ